MPLGLAPVFLIVSAKLLLIPLGIAAFLIFLALLGTLALGIAMSILSALSWCIRMPRRRYAHRVRRRREAR